MESTSPNGELTVVVRCHKILGMIPIDPRYHYYLSFRPETVFIPLEGDYSLKPGASCFKNDHVNFTWKKQHYMGYLQEFDSPSEDGPYSVLWEDNGVVIVLSKSGIAGRYQLKAGNNAQQSPISDDPTTTADVDR